MKTMKHQFMRGANSPTTLGFGLSSTQISTGLSIFTRRINWDWMATRRHTILNQIKAACGELELTKIMSFKYDWNKEIIYQFYATFSFDVDAQKLMWMTDGQRYEITVQDFTWLLGLKHQLTMEPEAWIHTYGVLKLDDM
jgi:hypothetical protein